jgi:hypothetical protein
MKSDERMNAKLVTATMKGIGCQLDSRKRAEKPITLHVARGFHRCFDSA